MEIHIKKMDFSHLRSFFKKEDKTYKNEGKTYFLKISNLTLKKKEKRRKYTSRKNAQGGINSAQAKFPEYLEKKFFLLPRN